MYKRITILILLLILLTLICGCSFYFNAAGENGAVDSILGDAAPYFESDGIVSDSPQSITEDGEYTDYKDVAAYIYEYGHLPSNYITKGKAMELGWVSSEGNLWEVTNHGCIGGDVFGNREGLLPEASGRVWFECDVNYTGGYRGSERIVYSSDGLIYYSSDHYQSFTKLY